MNTGVMRCVFAMIAAAAVGCGPSAPEPESGGGKLSTAGGGGSGEDETGAGPASAEVAQAISDQKARIESLEREIAAARDKVEADAASDPMLVEALIALEHDLVAGRSFLAHLERCTAGELACPPRLDEPAVSAEYDAATGGFGGAFTAEVETWAIVAEGLAASACACRTRVCVDWVMAELDRWEEALSESDEDHADAGVSVTAARECAWARLGK